VFCQFILFMDLPASQVVCDGEVEALLVFGGLQQMVLGASVAEPTVACCRGCSTGEIKGPNLDDPNCFVP